MAAPNFLFGEMERLAETDLPKYGTKSTLIPGPIDPRSFLTTITGRVWSSAGVGLSRRVLCIDRTTGELLSSTISNSGLDGRFEVRARVVAETIILVAVPEPGDLRNAVTLDNIASVES